MMYVPLIQAYQQLLAYWLLTEYRSVSLSHTRRVKKKANVMQNGAGRHLSKQAS